MNTAIALLIYPDGEESPNAFTRRAEVTANQIERLFDEVVAHLSRFRPDSELSRLNRNGAIEGCSPLLYEAISAALEMAGRTGGIFDPTILEALESAGYDHSFELIGDRQFSSVARFSFPNFEGYRGIELVPAQRAIRLPYATRLDLGGIGKGLAVDKATMLLRQAGFTNFMVSAGGDMYLSGREPENPAGWRVGVENPLTLEGELAALTVKDCAVATSSVIKRCWTLNGQTRHHLIDPRTGKPAATNLASVTVIAPTTQLADVLAKTALILGPAEGQKFIEQQPGCAALSVLEDGKLLGSASLPGEKF